VLLERFDSGAIGRMIWKEVSQDREIENGNFGMPVSFAPLTPRDPRLRPGEARRHRPHSKTLTVAVSEWRSPPS
jgi:hypothetical protein